MSLYRYSSTRAIHHSTVTGVNRVQVHRYGLDYSLR